MARLSQSVNPRAKVVSGHGGSAGLGRDRGGPELGDSGWFLDACPSRRNHHNRRISTQMATPPTRSSHNPARIIAVIGTAPVA